MNTRQKEISNGLIHYFDIEQKMQKIKILDLQDITSGWETEIFAFTLQYSKNEIEKQKKLVIRMYPGKFAESNLMDELFV